MKKFRKIAKEIFIETYDNFINIKNISSFEISEFDCLQEYYVKVSTFNNQSFYIAKFNDCDSANNYLHDLIDEISEENE